MWNEQNAINKPTSIAVIVSTDRVSISDVMEKLNGPSKWQDLEGNVHICAHTMTSVMYISISITLTFDVTLISVYIHTYM